MILGCVLWVLLVVAVFRAGPPIVQAAFNARLAYWEDRAEDARQLLVCDAAIPVLEDPVVNVEWDHNDHVLVLFSNYDLVPTTTN